MYCTIPICYPLTTTFFPDKVMSLISANFKVHHARLGHAVGGPRPKRHLALGHSTTTEAMMELK